MKELTVWYSVEDNIVIKSWIKTKTGYYYIFKNIWFIRNKRRNKRPYIKRLIRENLEEYCYVSFRSPNPPPYGPPVFHMTINPVKLKDRLECLAEMSAAFYLEKGLLEALNEDIL